LSDVQLNHRIPNAEHEMALNTLLIKTEDRESKVKYEMFIT